MDMRSYSGYFWAKDQSGFHDEDFLTKRAFSGTYMLQDGLTDIIVVWYAGAYTVQTNVVPLDTGRKVPFAGRGSAYAFLLKVIFFSDPADH